MSDEELKVQDAIVNSLISHYEAVINRYKTEIEQLKSMPSVKPQEPKTGHWIHTDECDEEWQYRCSECNVPSRSNGHRYCPNCGAYMYGKYER